MRLAPQRFLFMDAPPFPSWHRIDFKSCARKPLSTWLSSNVKYFFLKKVITLCTLLSVKIYGAPSWEVQRKGFGGYFTLGSQVLIPVISCSGFHRKFLLRTPTLSEKASASALNSLGRTRGGQSVEGRHLSEMEEREKFPEQKIWP